ncbi:MAG: AMP-binding protein [Ignavibacteriaceae bacterium]|nr:AMP-binding protein [Ignavibacteriaceae bacterium]
MPEYQHPTENNMRFANLVDVASYWAAELDHKTAYTFLSDGANQERYLTYRELDKSARAIAAFLQDAGLFGERALLFYPPGLEFICAFFGCLYAGVVAVPTYPPVNRQVMSLVEPIVKDAGPKAILTTSDIASKLKTVLSIQTIGEKSLFRFIGKGIEKFFPIFKQLGGENSRVIATDRIDTDLDQMWQSPNLKSDSLAFLQYTSGSTSQPKGVMVSHGNILHNQNLIQEYFRQPHGVVFVSWLPQYHDMGLIGNVLQPFYMGGYSVVFSPFEFLKKPLNWLTAISKYKAHTSGAPNFAYELCVRKVSTEDKKILDLSSWQVAYNGAEPIRHSTLENFADYFAECGLEKSALFPCYGLAEGTLIVAGGKLQEDPVYLFCDKERLKEDRIQIIDSEDPAATVLVGSGTAFDRQNVRVVDPEECIQLGDNEIGEIWVSGPSIALGYWNNLDSTQQTFQARIRNSDEDPFMRTGDLGFLRDGNLFITGRIKDLIIIHGQNYIPSDIEYTVENSHANLRKGCSAAVSLESDGEEKLAVVCEIRKKVKKVEFQDIVAGILHDISEGHGLMASRIVLIKTRTIPKTTSGKIRRKMCKMSLLNNKLEIVYQWEDKKSEYAADKPVSPENKGGVEALKGGSCTKEEVYGWLLEKINKTSADAITVDNLKEKSLADTGLGSLEQVELVTDFEQNFNCMVDIDELIQITSLSEFYLYLYHAAYKSSS